MGDNLAGPKASVPPRFPPAESPPRASTRVCVGVNNSLTGEGRPLRTPNLPGGPAGQMSQERARQQGRGPK